GELPRYHNSAVGSAIHKEQHLHYRLSLICRHPPTSTLFPYTTLFRSRRLRADELDRPLRPALRLHGACDRHRPRRDAQRTSHGRSEEHTSELQSPYDLVCRLLLEKKKTPDAFSCSLPASPFVF